MNCQQAQKEMGRALDRRLPQSEQRAFQMHILSCKPCRLQFDRHQKLQSWTRSLPSAKPGQDFSQRLFNRIQSGEGSPDGSLLQPVPIARKLRIFGAGAVTAAALMLGVFLIQDTLRGPHNDGSIAFRPVEPIPTSVSDPVRRAEFELNNAIVGLETAQGLKTVPAPNHRTLDNIRLRGKSIEDSMNMLGELLRRGEIRIALEGKQVHEFNRHMDQILVEARAMQFAPGEWLQQKIEESQRGSNSVLFLLRAGGGVDPATRTLRSIPIVRGKGTKEQ